MHWILRRFHRDHRDHRFHRVRSRSGLATLASLAAVIVFAGGVACTTVTALHPSAAAPTSAPAAPPAASPVAGGLSASDVASTSSAASAPVAAAAQPRAGAQPLAPAAAASSAAPNSGSATQSDAASDTSAQLLDRMVIRTAQLAVEVPDVEQALAQARAVALRADGYVSASNTHTERISDKDQTVADLTLQVRSDAVDSVMSALRALGSVTTESSGSQDVTEEYVDLDSNLRNLQASESAILKLMDKATQIQDVLSLQRELTNVRGQIERIQGRMNYLQHRTDLAIISLSLRPPTPAPGPAPIAGWDPLATAQRGWQASLTILRTAADAVIVVVAFSWWLLPLLALAAYVVLRRRRPAPAATVTEAV